MRRPAVFFDRDNTLIVGNDYLGDPAGVKLVAGAPAAVAKCRELGFAVVIVSNQSGVARGMFGEDDVHAVNNEMDRQLLAANPAAVIDRHEYCPHHPQGTVPAYQRECECRKPKAGMIYSAANAMALDLGASWLVGDAPRDIAAGKTAGCRTILIIDPTLAPSPAALHAADTPADFVVGSLVEAIEVITQDAQRPTHHSTNSQSENVLRTESTEEPLPAVAPAVPLPAEAKPEVAPKVQPAPTAPLIPAPTTQPVPTEPAPAQSSVIDRSPPPPAKTQATLPVAPAPAPVATPAPATGTSAAPIAKKPIAAAVPASAKPAAPQPTTVRIDLSRLETVSQQILMELKKLNEARHEDFSISKLMAGITQTLALAALPLAYVLYRNDANTFQAWLLTAIFLEMFTVGLLLMGKQR